MAGDGKGERLLSRLEEGTVRPRPVRELEADFDMTGGGMCAKRGGRAS